MKNDAKEEIQNINESKWLTGKLGEEKKIKKEGSLRCDDN